MKTKISNIIIFVFIGFLTLINSSCEKSDLNEFEQTAYGTVTLNLSAYSSLNTKTVLTGPENFQHVTYVQLYIFKKGNNDDDSYCVASENVDWKMPTGNTISQAYNVKAQLEDGEYVFLAVGLDEANGNKGSDTTYGLPDAITAGEGNTGTKLSEAIASLAEEKTVADIAESELFAGYENVTIAAGTNQNVTINLYRRVAGVMLYVKNPPQDATSVDVVLYDGQNTKVHLLKQQGADFITSTSTEVGAEVVISIDQSSFTQETVYSKGSYVLPMAGPATGVTFKLHIKNVSGQLIKEINIKKSDKDVWGEASAYAFPIVANNFYSIGTEGNPIDLSTDDDIVLTVNAAWEHIYELEGE